MGLDQLLVGSSARYRLEFSGQSISKNNQCHMRYNWEFKDFNINRRTQPYIRINSLDERSGINVTAFPANDRQDSANSAEMELELILTNAYRNVIGTVSKTVTVITEENLQLYAGQG